MVLLQNIPEVMNEQQGTLSRYSSKVRRYNRLQQEPVYAQRTTKLIITNSATEIPCH